MAENGTYATECGRRLADARVALEYEKRAKFVRAVFGDDDPEQFTRDQDNVRKWENGEALVPPGFIAMLKRLHGVTHDYIYDDDLASTPHNLALKIQKIRDLRARPTRAS